MMPPLQLSLQFGLRGRAAAAHRAALPRTQVARWIRHSLQRPGEIAVRVVDEAEGLDLNLQHRQRHYATNVLTFDYAQQPIVMADLVLCAPVVLREASELGISLGSHYAHLVVHGVLHAQGWDHEADEAQALAMEQRETLILTSLGFADPYADRE